MGFALAAAVFFDAFIVRMALIPALMYLHGREGLVAADVARPDPARTSTSRARSSSGRTCGAARYDDALDDLTSTEAPV